MNLLSDQQSTFRISLKFEPEGAGSKGKATIDVTFTLPSAYPESIPDVSLVTNVLTRETCHKLRTDLLDYARTLEAEPMIMILIDWIKDHWQEYVTHTVDKCNGKVSSQGEASKRSFCICCNFSKIYRYIVLSNTPQEK